MPRCFRPLLFALFAVLSAAASAQSPGGLAAPTGTITGSGASSGNLEWVGSPYPNPFTDTATLQYALSRPSPVRVELFDALGQRVSLIEDEERPAGEYRVRFNGGTLTPGLYIIRLTAGDQFVTRRLVRSN